MSDSAAELSVVIRGKEIGIKSMLAALERDLKQADRAASQAGKAVGDNLAASQQRAADQALRLAQAQARLASASGDAAGAVRILQNALRGVDQASLSAINAQTQLARAQSAVVRQQTALSGASSAGRDTLNALKDGLVGIAGPAALGSAALGGLTAAVQSFGNAFTFKAQLDATNASVAIQLNGIRDSGTVFAQAQTYGEKYKLTQQEIANTVQASVGIFRTSTASVEDTFSVLQRLTVLAPGKSIEDAAFSVRELASGDITSLAEQFNISRTKAYEMRDAINSGKDVISVLNTFLTNSGVGMEALATRTQGAVGAMKDLAIAQEELKLAQAEFAQGPGLALLQLQIQATTGATRVLSGDFNAMGASIQAALQGISAEFQAQTAQADAYATAIGQGVPQVEAAAQANQVYADTLAIARGEFELGTSGGKSWAVATTDSANAATTASAAINVLGVSLDAAAQQSLIDQANTEALSKAKAELQAQAQAAANGILTSGANIEAEAARLAASSSLIDQLTAAYLRLAVASGEAEAAARKAAGAQRLQNQAAQTRDLTDGGLGFNAPGRGKRQTTDETIAIITRTQQEVNRVEATGQATRTRTARAGGSARVSAEEKANDQALQAAQEYQDRVAQIEADGLKRRQEAENSLRQAQLSGRAGFYASLANIDDNALRQDLSARYEAAAQEAAKIAQTQGADAAEAYLEASRRAIEGEAQIQQQIDQARKDGNTGEVEYLEGVLKLQQAANAEELRQIQEKGSAIAQAQQAQYTEAEKRYAEHLDRMQGIASSKGVTLAGTVAGGSAAIPAPSGTATPTPSSQAQPVQDVATPPAIDSQTAQLGGKLDGVIAAVLDVANRVSAVERAVGGLKQSRATAGG